MFILFSGKKRQNQGGCPPSSKKPVQTWNYRKKPVLETGMPASELLKGNNEKPGLFSPGT